MTRKKRVPNPNIIANPVILPEARDTVASKAKDIKHDSHKVSLGADSKK